MMNPVTTEQLLEKCTVVPSPMLSKLVTEAVDAQLSTDFSNDKVKLLKIFLFPGVSPDSIGIRMFMDKYILACVREDNSGLCVLINPNCITATEISLGAFSMPYG